MTIQGGQLSARFGPWRLSTPLENVAGTEVTGPYQLLKVIGPPHLSLRDRGLTFATNRQRGVCIRFRRPVGLLRHPSLTVTVADPDALARALED